MTSPSQRLCFERGSLNAEKTPSPSGPSAAPRRRYSEYVFGRSSFIGFEASKAFPLSSVESFEKQNDIGSVQDTEYWYRPGTYGPYKMAPTKKCFSSGRREVYAARRSRPPTARIGQRFRTAEVGPEGVGGILKAGEALLPCLKRQVIPKRPCC